jgi:hypothetical protein
MNDEDKLTDLINSGADITGGVAGGVIGFLLAGPVGAAIGGGSGPIVTSVLKKIGLEIKERLISPREEIRVGATISYAIEKIKSRLDSGTSIRNDNFFNSSSTKRSDADEIYEATILAAQREYQEKKLKYYGNLVANISFDPACDKAQANHLIRIVQELSWRQICIISLTARKSNFNLRNLNYINQPTMSHAHVFLLDEIMELYNKSLIVFGNDFLMGMTGIHPSRMQLEGVGVHLHNMMELSTIPDQELEDIAVLLR